MRVFGYSHPPTTIPNPSATTALLIQLMESSRRACRLCLILTKTLTGQPMRICRSVVRACRQGGGESAYLPGVGAVVSVSAIRYPGPRSIHVENELHEPQDR